jgi:predicted xylose isomerase-like sugar epimerase
MATNPTLPPQNDTHWYKAVVRISKAIAACREPQELANTDDLTTMGRDLGFSMPVMESYADAIRRFAINSVGV